MNKNTVLVIGVFVGLILVAITFYISTVEQNEPAKIEDIEQALDTENLEKATFASGCFWCMEAIMQETDGVTEVVSGYAGGAEVDPTYEDVYKGKTGHRETVQVYFDPSAVTYEELLDIFWKNIDPTDDGGQFVDRGFSYTTAIFYHDDAQKEAAEQSLKELDNSDRFDSEIVTEIIPYTSFYPAEEYHQDYYKKSSTRYNLYKDASGREDFKRRVWEEIQKEQGN